MSEAMRLWVETSFNIVYLIAVWWIVLLMWQRRELVTGVCQLRATTGDVI